MPLLSPKKGEPEKDFVARFMGNEAMKKEYPDEKQRLALAYSQYKKGKKETIFCKISGLEIKETDSDDLVRGGYIATTHLDSGFYDSDRGVWVRDKIALDTLKAWEKEINEGNPRANKVSINHNREPHVAGVGLKGTARVDDMGNGEYGLYVESLVDKTKDNFKDTQYRIEKGLLDSFSIEFTTKDPVNGDYLPNAAIEKQQGSMIYRTLLPGTQLEGWTLASQPMNEHAVMIKEFLDNIKNTSKEDVKMTEHKEEEQPVEEPKEEVVEEVKPEAELTEEQKELIKLGKQAKLENKQKELKETIVKEVKEQLAKVEVKDKVTRDNVDKVEVKEFVEYKSMLQNADKMPISEQFKIAARAAEKKGMIVNGYAQERKSSVFKQYETKIGNKNGMSTIEFKGLGVTTNQNTDTDYLLSAAELQDIFDPVIYNALNQQTTTWNVLQKDDYSGKGNNQVQFKLKITANTTAAAYTGNAVNTGNVTRTKYMTKFKKYQVGVEVDGDMVAAANPVDVFAMEVKDSVDDLMAVINAALYAEVGAETDSGVIGFEYITDHAGNTTLYNETRSAANALRYDSSATETYINQASADITLANLRAAKRQALKQGAMIENLVFFTDHIQGDKFRGIYDSIQRLPPTSSRFGFVGRLEFDGIPIFEDKDCNDDDWFLVDLETHRIAIWVPPTLEMLGKDSDSQKGFIKTYFATYNRAPKRMVQIYGCSTS